MSQKGKNSRVRQRLEEIRQQLKAGAGEHSEFSPAFSELERAWAHAEAAHLGVDQQAILDAAAAIRSSDWDAGEEVRLELSASEGFREVFDGENILECLIESLQLGFYPPPEILLLLIERLDDVFEKEIDLETALLGTGITAKGWAKKRKREKEDWRIALKVRSHMYDTSGNKRMLQQEAIMKALADLGIDEFHGTMARRLRRNALTRKLIS